MKATKKIVGATAALVAAVALSAGSTFAWFATSGQVNVNNMSVQVQTADNLVIKKATEADTAYGNSIDFESTTKTLLPASTVGGTSPTFFKLLVAGSGMTVGSAVFDTNTTFEEATASNTGTFDVYKESFNLMLIGEAAKQIDLTLIATPNESATIDNALRVMLVITPGSGATSATATSVIYNPIGTAENYEAIASLTDSKPSGESDLTKISVTCGTDGTVNDTAITSMSANIAYTVDVYIWYEGQDTSCTAFNSAASTTIDIDIQFATAS